MVDITACCHKGDGWEIHPIPANTLENMMEEEFPTWGSLVDGVQLFLLGCLYLFLECWTFNMFP